tara:strand:- start:3620 stop:4249 length:630 start_codon:yes stop_codon:yes gene_type:complete
MSGLWINLLSKKQNMKKFDDILQSVEASCRERHIPMLGPEKAKFLKQIVRKVQPNIMIECGTAIGYSGLWIAHELQAIGTGKLITIEIDPERASEAQSNFTQAGVSHLVDSRIGDARNVLNDIDVAVDLLLLDNDFQNYFPCFQAIEPQLTNEATLVADNVGIGADSMKDYLDYTRSRYQTELHWFEIDLPWVNRDAVEIAVYQKPPSA